MDGSNFTTIGFRFFLFIATFLTTPVAATNTKLTSDQKQFLETVRSTLSSRFEKDIAWSNNIISCFQGSCSDNKSYQQFLIEAPQVIKTYRTLLILANYERVLENHGAIPTGFGLPTLNIDVNAKKKFSELEDIQVQRKGDQQAIERELVRQLQTMRRSSSVNYSDEKIAKIFVRNSSLESQKYYKGLASQMVGEFPYLSFIDKATPRKNDMIRSMQEFSESNQDTREKVNGMSLESFIAYAPIIEEVLSSHPEWNATYIYLSKTIQGPEWSIDFWKDTLTSAFALGTAGCFILAGITGFAPLALVCSIVGASVASYFFVQSTLDYMKEMKFYRLGLTREERFKTVERRLYGMGVMLGLSVIGLGGAVVTVRSAEEPIRTALQTGLANLKTRVTDVKELVDPMKEWAVGWVKGQTKNLSVNGGFSLKGQNASKKIETLNFPTYAEVIDAKTQFLHAMQR